MGSGGALLDFDQDGDLDLYLVQGGTLEGKTSPPASDRLYRNELIPSGTLHFTDGTAGSGIVESDYGMGAAAADYDNDGWTDLLVTNWGASNRLWRNQGNGTFQDVTDQAGLRDARWGTTASWFDLDRDGWLDLYIGHYVDFRLEMDIQCRRANSAPDYCGPTNFTLIPSRLYRNRRDGSFEDITVKSGVASAYGPSLGSVALDADDDGWLDLYVANDGTDNHLWMNRQDGTFQEECLLRGCAVDADGKAQGSMGLDAADFDGDGDEDLFMTHLRSEMNTYYRNVDSGVFQDASIDVGLGPPSRPWTGFGTLALDYDLDGWLDVITVNGAVIVREEQERQGIEPPLLEPRQLFRNLGQGRFQEISQAAGTAFQGQSVGRGAIFGDLDNDGDTDVVVVNNGGPVHLLENQTAPNRAWIGLRLLTGRPSRDALGSRVGLHPRSGRKQWRRVKSDGSYLSSNDPRVVFALAAGESAQVEVHWLDGQVEYWSDLQPGQYHSLVQGTGQKSLVARSGETTTGESTDSGLPSPVLIHSTTALAPNGRPAEGSGSDPVLQPNLQGVEPAVVEQLRGQIESLRTLRKDPSIQAERLGQATGELCRLYQAYEILDSAIPCYREAARFQPEEFAWPYLLGHALRVQNRQNEAIEVWDRILARQQQVSLVRLALAQSHLEIGHPSESRKLAEDVLRSEPENVVARFLLGRVEQETGHPESAIPHFEAVLKSQPQASIVHYPLAMALRSTGQLDRAQDELARRGNRPIEANDPWMAVLNELRTGVSAELETGKAAFEKQDFAAAATAFRKVLEKDPDHAAARLNLSVCLLRLGDQQASVGELEELLHRHPEHIDGHFNLGSVLSAAGQPERAILEFETVLRLDSGHLSARINLANTLLRADRCQEALPHYRQVRERDPAQELAHRGEALCLYRIGDFKGSLARWEAAVRLLPQSQSVAEGLARCLAACADDTLRDGRRAAELAHRLLQQNRSLPHVETLGMALAEIGNFDEAVQWQSAALEAARKAGRFSQLQILQRNLSLYQQQKPCREPWSLNPWGL